MCPLYPLHLVFSWGFLLLVVWVCGGESLASSLQKNVFSIRLLANDSLVESLDLTEEETKTVTFFVDDLPAEYLGDIILKEKSENRFGHIKMSRDRFPVKYDPVTGESKPNEVNVTGEFLGFSKIKFILDSDSDVDKQVKPHEVEISVKVERKPKLLDIIFVAVIVLLVVIAYTNMGCAINMEVIKDSLKRPVAPGIGLASQYLFMPLVSYGLGYVFFPSKPELWLALFLTGCAPGGGGSNMWTYLLGGSLDLSITMTFLSTMFAFATLPIWVYALAPSIFADGTYGELPYRKIAGLVFGLVVPCAIGVGIRRWRPKIADFLKRMLKPVCLLFIVFIMTFGIYAKFDLFYFLTWKVALSGFCLPLFGFIFGGSSAILMKRKWEEIIAVSIETGVQNTGLAIGVIQIALRDFSPMDDIALVLPITVAMMTPIPLLACLAGKWLRDRRSPKGLKVLTDHCEDSPIKISQIQQFTETNGYGDVRIP